MQDTIALCGGCAARGSACRFGADRFVALSATQAIAHLSCPDTFEGGPRVAHGGWTAATFDDVMGRFLSHTGIRSVTATLTTRYLAPVPVDMPLELMVRVGVNDGRRWPVTASLRLAGDDRDVAAAEGVWVERRPDHFQRHESRLTAFQKTRPVQD